jgi:hypothetical protein
VETVWGLLARCRPTGPQLISRKLCGALVESSRTGCEPVNVVRFAIIRKQFNILATVNGFGQPSPLPSYSHNHHHQHHHHHIISIIIIVTIIDVFCEHLRFRTFCGHTQTCQQVGCREWCWPAITITYMHTYIHTYTHTDTLRQGLNKGLHEGFHKGLHNGPHNRQGTSQGASKGISQMISPRDKKEPSQQHNNHQPVLHSCIQSYMQTDIQTYRHDELPIHSIMSVHECARRATRLAEVDSKLDSNSGQHHWPAALASSTGQHY